MARGYKFVEGSERPFVCLKCGRVFPSEGGYKLHGPSADGKCPGGPAYGKGKNQKDSGNGSRAGGCKKCGGALRFLKATVVREKKAIDAGYGMVCRNPNCEEVY